MEQPKAKNTSDEATTVIDKISGPDPSSLTTDQLRRSYYYDDAHGYEVYRPDEESDQTEADNDKPTLDGPAAADGS